MKLEQSTYAAPRLTDNLYHSVHNFLIYEAECMDDHRYDDWLALWDKELLYWVPCDPHAKGPQDSVSIIQDSRTGLETRLNRLKGRHAYSQQPQSRLMRSLSNLVIRDESQDAIVCSSQFVLGDWRLDRQTVWFGRTTHTLRRDGDRLYIKQKKVVLLNCDGPLGNLTYVL